MSVVDTKDALLLPSVLYMEKDQQKYDVSEKLSMKIGHVPEHYCLKESGNLRYCWQCTKTSVVARALPVAILQYCLCFF